MLQTAFLLCLLFGIFYSFFILLPPLQTNIKYKKSFKMQFVAFTKALFCATITECYICKSLNLSTTKGNAPYG